MAENNVQKYSTSFWYIEEFGVEDKHFNVKTDN